MFIHAIDTTGNLQIASASEQLAPAHAQSAIGSSMPPSSGWRVVDHGSTTGLCFIRKGGSDWKSAVTSCEGRVRRLGNVDRQMVAQSAGVLNDAPPESSMDVAAASPVDTVLGGSDPWRSWTSYLALIIAMGIATRSGTVVLGLSRKYG